MNEMDNEWVPTRWELLSALRTFSWETITIDLCVSPHYPENRFAVRRVGACLARDGVWEYEPSPSNRDDAFYERCRFLSRDEAAAAALKAMEAPKSPRRRRTTDEVDDR